MPQFSRKLNFIFLSALLTAIAFTWLAPKVIGALFTPPVSFGTNCEPAAAWSMSKLIWTQLIGLVAGGVGSLIWVLLPSDKKPSEPEIKLK